MSVLDGSVLWGATVDVSPPGRERVIQELHEIHPGIARMKSLARNSVWWPSMDADKEAKCELVPSVSQVDLQDDYTISEEEM